MYDLLISFGETCATSMTLRHLGLQKYTMPFDWSAGILQEKCGACGLRGKIDMVINNFDHSFDINDYEEFEHDNQKPHRQVRNKKTGLQYIHDFTWNESIKDQFNQYKNKYNRRVKRFYELLEKSKKPLIVFISRWNSLPIDDILYAQTQLQEKFHKKIDFLVMQNEKLLDTYETRTYQLTNSITLILYNDIATTSEPSIGNLICMRKEIMKFLGGQYISFIYDKLDLFGVCEAEEWGRWTNGSKTLLKINTINFTDDIHISFNIVPYLRKNFPSQQLSVYCNDTFLLNWDFKYESYTQEQLISLTKPITNNIIIPNSSIHNNKILLTFNIKKPIKPSYIEKNNDIRDIGIAFIDAIIEPIKSWKYRNTFLNSI